MSKEHEKLFDAIENDLMCLDAFFTTLGDCVHRSCWPEKWATLLLAHGGLTIYKDYLQRAGKRTFFKDEGRYQEIIAMLERFDDEMHAQFKAMGGYTLADIGFKDVDDMLSEERAINVLFTGTMEVMKPKRKTINDWVRGLKRLSRDEIIDRLGAEKWTDVMVAFDGMTLSDIRNELAQMWPHEPEANDELAQAIMAEFLGGDA